MRSRARVLAVSAALLLVASCSGDKDSSSDGKIADTQTATTKVDGGTPAPSLCALTSVDQVRTVFGAPVEAQLDDEGRCRYGVDGGFVRFQVWSGPETISVLAPDGTPVADIGSAALWSGSAADGGRLVVDIDGTKLIFEAFLSGIDADAGKARLVGWANLVVAEYADGGIDATPTIPVDDDERYGEPKPTIPTASADPCVILSPDDVEKITGVKQAPAADHGVCRYDLSNGGTLTVGPLTASAPSDTLAGLSHSTSINGDATPWARQDLDIFGGAVIFDSPDNPGTIEFYVMDGGDLLHIGITSTTSELAKKMALDVLAAR